MTPPEHLARRRPHGIGALKLVFFALIPVSVLAAVAEIAAAFTIVRSAHIETMVDGGREYRMRIGRWPWTRETRTTINSDGFPDREFPAVGTPKTCVHVVLVGDSFVLGDGVDGDSSFTSIVGRTLATLPDGRCVRTFNLGERGSTIPRQARRVRELRARLAPDIVILAQYQNDLTDLLEQEPRDLGVRTMTADFASRADLTTGIRVTTEGRRIREPLPVVSRISFLKPRFVRYLAYHTFAALISSGIHRDELERWSVLADSTRKDEAARLQEQYTASFDSLAIDLARDSIAFGVIVLPSKFDLMAGRFPEEPFFLRTAARHRLPALRLFPVLDANRRPYAFLMYDGHLNAHGNRLVANAVTEWLLRTAPAPFPLIRGQAVR